MTRSKAEILLRQMLGADAQFRDGQWEAIDRLVNHRRRVLLVQRTGWGKSIVYFLAAKILRDAGRGPTLLISPLLALMRNQIAMAERLGIRAVTVNSEDTKEWSEVKAALRENRCDALLISPERLANEYFSQRLLPIMKGQIGLFVVDEAHCISDWGHDFRPDYRRIVGFLDSLSAGVPVLCTTATANNRVVTDVLAQISDLEAMRGPLTRQSLKLFNIRLEDQAERLAYLAQTLPQLPGSGIVYCLTVGDTHRVAAWLQANGIEARAYNGHLPDEERIQVEQMLLNNELKALVATVALGMGFDKPDLGFVIHFQRPGSVVSYYQQVGRAGRAVDTAFGILLAGREDDEIADYFIRTAFPPAETMRKVLDVLDRAGATGLTVEEIWAAENERRATVKKALKLLEVDNAVRHERDRYVRTPNPWTPSALPAETVTALRSGEVEQMRRYVEHTDCLMEFLARALDDPSPAPCGKCMNCTGKSNRKSLPPKLLRQAVEFLRGQTLVIEPHPSWPEPALDAVAQAMPFAVGKTQNGDPSYVIPETLRAQEGRALSQWRDAGWGCEVARGKYEVGRFSDTLVDACVKLLREKWRPEPFPAWVTAVPSRRKPELVSDFAGRLAVKLGMLFRPVLRKTRETHPQKQMQNSVTQVRNLLGAFKLTGPVPDGAVLLVDDLVDSGWTLTVSAVLLRQHGSGPVYPLALAKASPRDD